MKRAFAAEVLRPGPLLFALAVWTCATDAQAVPGNWYVAGAVTGSALDKPRQTIANAPTPGSTLHVVNDVDFGWGGQGEIGYALRFFRIEAEIGYTANHSSQYSAVSPIAITLPQSGKNHVTRYMANAYVEPFRERWPVSPYIGAGLGAAHGHLTTYAAPARVPAVAPSQTLFAYQFMGGMSVPFTPGVALSVQYRWLDSGTFHGVDSRGERATRTLHGSNIDVGLRFAF
jgi:opacity protein-like surface antigen